MSSGNDYVLGRNYLSSLRFVKPYLPCIATITKLRPKIECTTSTVERAAGVCAPS